MGERVDHFETVRQRKDGTNLGCFTDDFAHSRCGRQSDRSIECGPRHTERKRVKRALSEQARLLDLSSDAIFVRDPDDHISYWNRAANELYGFTREEALGRVSHELLRINYPRCWIGLTNNSTATSAGVAN